MGGFRRALIERNTAGAHSRPPRACLGCAVVAGADSDIHPYQDRPLRLPACCHCSPTADGPDATALIGDKAIPVCATTGRCSVYITFRLVTTVEMACLKINCSWLLFSRSTEYLSKDRIFPVSLTPLTR